VPTDDITTRTRTVADGLTRTVEAVADDAWDRPAPCDGWVARDVVDHLVGWMPPFFLEGWDRPVPDIPSARTDPVGAWHALDTALRKALRQTYPQLAEMQLVDYKVRVINSSEGTAARVRVVIESRDDHDVWSTVGVSENVIEASWLALVDSIEYKLCKDNS